MPTADNVARSAAPKSRPPRTHLSRIEPKYTVFPDPGTTTFASRGGTR
ncbi:hypothetical protein SFUMM280S_01381 [Streptomyces fumanus]